MDKKKIKRIIAKEGLVIIRLMLIGGLIEILRAFLYNIRPHTRFKYLYVPDQIIVSGLITVVICYPVYLFIRFIIWAIRTLRER